MRNLKTLLLVLVIAVVAVACSSESEKSLQAKAQQPDKAGIESAARIVADAILASDGTALFAQSSRECKKDTNPDKLDKRLKSTFGALKTFLKADIADVKVVQVSAKNVEEGKSGEVSFDLQATGSTGVALQRFVNIQNEGLSALKPKEGEKVEVDENKVTFTNTTTPFEFVYEDGAWRIQDCDELLSQSGLLSGAKNNE